MNRFVPISKVDAEKQLVYGEVYVPNVLDSQGDFMSPEEVEKAAHLFMEKKRGHKIDVNHDLEETGSFVVESFVARKGDLDFIEGAWVVGVKIPDVSLWNQVKKGDLNGFSLFGTASKRVSQEIEVEIPDDGIIKGDTLSSDGHDHTYEIGFSETGEFLGGKTSTVNGHFHAIKKGTATESAMGHVHRYSFLEMLV